MIRKCSTLPQTCTISLISKNQSRILQNGYNACGISQSNNMGKSSVYFVTSTLASARNIALNNNQCALRFRCFISSDAVNGSSNKTRRNEKSNIIRNSQGSHSESLGLGDLKYEPPPPDIISSTLEIGSNGASMALSQEDISNHVAPSWLNGVPKRWVIVVLCFFAFLLCNMDRASNQCKFPLNFQKI